MDGRGLHQCASEWLYLFRAVDRDGQTLDFILSEKRNTQIGTYDLKMHGGSVGDNLKGGSGAHIMYDSGAGSDLLVYTDGTDVFTGGGNDTYTGVAALAP